MAKKPIGVIPLNGNSKRTSLIRNRVILSVVVSGFIAVLFCTVANAEWHQQDWSIMGTTVGARIWWPDEQEAQQMLEAVRLEMERIDQTYSPYIDSSPLSQVNRLAAKSPQPLSQEFAQLIDKALWVSHISHGAFDITYASVGHLYDYRAGVQPSEQQIQNQLAAVGRLDWNRQMQTLAFAHPGVKIDLGGLAKGYAVDSAVAILKKHGVQHASVNAGGDTRLLGDNLGRPWVIGIKNPRPASSDEQWQSVLKLPLVDEAISTSGDYERYFIDQKTGERVHHIINPETGKSTRELISVTVIGPHGFTTDPLSTAVFVLGVDKGFAMIDKIAGYKAIAIERSGTIRYSSGLSPPGQD